MVGKPFQRNQAGVEQDRRDSREGKFNRREGAAFPLCTICNQVSFNKVHQLPFKK